MKNLFYLLFVLISFSSCDYDSLTDSEYRELITGYQTVSSNNFISSLEDAVVKGNYDVKKEYNRETFDVIVDTISYELKCDIIINDNYFECIIKRHLKTQEIDIIISDKPDSIEKMEDLSTRDKLDYLDLKFGSDKYHTYGRQSFYLTGGYKISVSVSNSYIYMTLIPVHKLKNEFNSQIIIN